MLTLPKPKCESFEITTIRNLPESHLHWKYRFHKSPLFIRIYADLEADNGKDNSSVGNKTTNFYKQNLVLNGYRIQSDMDDVLQSGYYRSPLGNDNVDWFVRRL